VTTQLAWVRRFALDAFSDCIFGRSFNALVDGTNTNELVRLYKQVSDDLQTTLLFISPPSIQALMSKTIFRSLFERISAFRNALTKLSTHSPEHDFGLTRIVDCLLSALIEEKLTEDEVVVQFWKN
jgi:hypothetical protein